MAYHVHYENLCQELLGGKKRDLEIDKNKAEKNQTWDFQTAILS